MQKKAISIVYMVLMTSFINMFLIQTSVATPPIISNPYPIGDQLVTYNPVLTVTINDAENDPLTVIFKTNASGTWQTLGTYNDGNKIYTQNTSNMDNKTKKYYWSINVSDGTIWVNSTYRFIVQAFVLRWSQNINLETTKPPLASDVDHDGIYEVFAIGNNTICCFNGSTGTIRWRYNNTDFLGYDSQMEIGDLNNDGIEELVASAKSKTIALHANNGTPYWGNAKGEVRAESSNKNIIIADIEGNGYPYVYIASDDTTQGENGLGRIRKLSGTDGEILAEVFAFRPCYGSLSLADSDNDGKFELYSTDRSYSLTDDGAGRGMICYDADTLKILWYNDMITCSSHCQALVDVNNDGILDSVALQEIGGASGIYVVDGRTWDKMIGKWGEDLDNLTAHSQPTVYDIDNDGNLELITCQNASPKIWDLGSWSLENTTYNLINMSEPPRMGNVIGDEKLEIIDALNNVSIYNQNYTRVEVIKTKASAHTLVQDLDHNGRNELILISQGAVKVYDTSGVAPAKLPRTNSEFYSERRTGAGVYIPPPGAPQPIIKEINPKNNSQDVQLNTILSARVVDFHYDYMNIKISTNASGSWVDVKSVNNVGNGWYNYTPTNMNQPKKTYYWRVTAVDPDADNMITSETYRFTTNTPPVITNIVATPDAISPGEKVNVSCNVIDNKLVNNVKVSITNPNGGTINVTALGGEPKWELLTYDDFESGWGNYTDGGTDCSRYTGTTYSHQGTHAIKLQDYKDINSSVILTESIDVDTPRYTSLKIDFWFKASDMEYRENIWVKYFDGTYWRIVGDYLHTRDFSNETYYYKTIWINETNYTFPKNMKIRFQCDASDDSDNVYIDQIYINATTAQGPQYYYNNTYTQSGVYHYFIWANDGSGNTYSSVSNSFTIYDEPYIVSNPTPLNGATSISKNDNLSWTIWNPENDLVTYDIYFGMSSNPPLLVHNQSGLTYNPDTLSSCTKYYWKVVTWVNHSLKIIGPTWYFTTEGCSSGGGDGGTTPSEPQNKKPIANTSAGEPYTSFVNSIIVFNGSNSYDLDGNITTWFWVFGDNTNGTGKTVQHVYSKAGTYNVTLTVTDNEGATNTDTTICVIKQQNRPPSTPIITGPSIGMKNTIYIYTTVSTDMDNDKIQYTFDWDDPLSIPQSSGFLPNGTGFTTNHSWTSAGRYDVTVIVTDNQTQTTSKIIVYIDAVQTGDIGYLLDNDSDGIYEAFYSDALKQITTVQKKDGYYNIDNDGDGTLDYTFDVIQGLALYQKPKTPGFDLVFVLCAIAVSILLWKKKRNA